MSQLHYVPSRILRINVGFLLAESIGQSRDIEIDVDVPVSVAEDLMLDGLHGTLHLSRNSRGILVEGALRTHYADECARCLEEASVPLELDVQELYIHPAEPDAPWVVADDGNLDLAPLVREEMILGTPHTILCRPDCAGLCPDCGENLNDGPCQCAAPIDPRMAALLNWQPLAEVARDLPETSPTDPAATGSKPRSRTRR